MTSSTPSAIAPQTANPNGDKRWLWIVFVVMVLVLVPPARRAVTTVIRETTGATATAIRMAFGAPVEGMRYATEGLDYAKEEARAALAESREAVREGLRSGRTARTRAASEVQPESPLEATDQPPGPELADTEAASEDAVQPHPDDSIPDAEDESPDRQQTDSVPATLPAPIQAEYRQLRDAQRSGRLVFTAGFGACVYLLLGLTAARLRTQHRREN